MPETTIIFDRDDEERLISAVLREGGRLIANRHPSQNYAEITEWDAYAGARSGERLFFLLNDAYARWPLSLTRCEGGYYAGTYSVKQRWGGPTIDLLLCVEY